MVLSRRNLHIMMTKHIWEISWNANLEARDVLGFWLTWILLWYANMRKWRKSGITYL